MKDFVIVGCGNPIRGDDGVGPYIIRRLWEEGVPPNIELFDGGTSGLDIIFHIKGAKHVIFIDACITDDEPGSIYHLPLEEIEEIPDLRGGNLHSIKWFEAVTIGRNLLQEEFPKNCEVILINGKNFGVGEPLSEEVKMSAEKVVQHLKDNYFSQKREVYTVEITEDGHLIMPPQLSEKHFRDYMNITVIPKGMNLYITPVKRATFGGILLKRISREGERAALIWEFLPPGKVSGKKKAVWIEEENTLVVSLT